MLLNSQGNTLITRKTIFPLDHSQKWSRGTGIALFFEWVPKQKEKGCSRILSSSSSLNINIP